MNQAIILVVLTPLATAIVGSLVPLRWEKALRALVVLAAAGHAFWVYRIIAALARSDMLLYAVGGWPAPRGILLVADPLSTFFLVIISAGQIVFLTHAIAQERTPRKSMWVLTELLVASISGIAVAGDLFNLFVFVELASVSSVGLITHKQRSEGAGAGFVYLLFASISGLLFLVCVVLLYSTIGSLTLADIAAGIHQIPAGAYRTVVGLMIASIGIKFGLVPFHFWQAPAYEAAGSSAAAFLSGTVMKVYLYLLIRVLFHLLRAPVFFPPLGVVLLVFGMVNILAGHTLALAERDLKRLLAFSSVAHVGYILIGLAAATGGRPDNAILAVSAALLHVTFHALMKTAIFYSGRSLIALAGNSTIERLRGTGRVERIGLASFVLSAIALIGVPPAGGFFSKWRVASVAAGVYGAAPVVVIAAGTVLSMLYYGRILGVCLSLPGTRPREHARTSRFPLFLIACLALATLVVGLFGPAVESALTRIAATIVNGEAYLIGVREGR